MTSIQDDQILELEPRRVMPVTFRIGWTVPYPNYPGGDRFNATETVGLPLEQAAKLIAAGVCDAADPADRDQYPSQPSKTERQTTTMAQAVTIEMLASAQVLHPVYRTASFANRGDIVTTAGDCAARLIAEGAARRAEPGLLGTVMAAGRRLLGKGGKAKAPTPEELQTAIETAKGALERAEAAYVAASAAVDRTHRDEHGDDLVRKRRAQLDRPGLLVQQLECERARTKAIAAHAEALTIYNEAYVAPVFRSAMAAHRDRVITAIEALTAMTDEMSMTRDEGDRAGVSGLPDLPMVGPLRAWADAMRASL